ncbi:protein tincar [Holotrichia oblita]|uniref:Protein tincar n=1 Tax=Holotrichia oblita TaxID=644536 RepID=A0ACB9T461_HOLOL|nr:protein tincar [Holotrichia oblita]
MNTSLILTGAAILFIPFFVVTAIFKVGNLANDGHKLGRHLSACSKERASEQFASSSGCNCWKFGGPTGPFLHIVIAFCLMLPKLLMQARFIEAGFFPPEMIWRTDLNFMSLHNDQMVILNFMTLTSNDTTKGINTRMFTEPTVTTMNIEDNTVSNVDVEKGSMSLASAVVNILKDYIGTDDRSYNVIEYERSNQISIEFINFTLALGIYAVRYASLFWATSKWLSLLFSVQLLLNGIQILFPTQASPYYIRLRFTSDWLVITLLFKINYSTVNVICKLCENVFFYERSDGLYDFEVQIMGGLKALPFYKHQIAKSMFTDNSTPFLLNSLVSILLYILYVLLIISSSLVFYLYGHIRFKNFLNQNCQRKVILLKEGNTSRWIYFTHCAALFLLIAIGVCSAPLFYDYLIVYRGSLNSTILFCIIGGILHLFLWIVLWLFLTIKQNWDFKLRITIGNASVKQSNSIKLAAEVFHTKKHDNFEQPLLVASNGYVYSVTENNLKSDIVDILHKDLSKSNTRSADTLSSDDNSDNQIYWLKSELFDSRDNHFKHIKEKRSTDRPASRMCTHDDGDYATLKKPENKDVDDVTEVDKLLSEVHIMDISYANTNQDLIPIEEESKEDSTEHLIPNTSSNATIIEATNTVITHEPQKIQLHKCKRTTSIVHDEGITKYDSISMESSNSPPDHPDSETSSGVHSNESADQQLFTCNQQNTTFQEPSKPPGTRVVPSPTVPEQIRESLKWKSCSLHRCVRPDSVDSSASVTNKYYSLNPNISVLQEQLLKKSICPHNLNQSKNASEDTLVICRKLQPFKLGESGCVTSLSVDDQFGRATNMRMSSFEHKFKSSHGTFSNISFNGSNKNIYTQCPSTSVTQANYNGSNISQPNALYQRQHTTIPSHHNGVELYNNHGHQYVKN